MPTVLFESLWQDLRYALRTMRQHPAFTATAALTLALGIGGNTAIFTVIRATLLKPLSYANADRLVYFSTADPTRNVADAQFARQRFDDLRAVVQSFEAIGAYGANVENVTLSGDAAPEPLRGARVSANFLGVLGVQPVIGRGFLPQEDTPGGPPVVMISFDLWQRHFAADPQIAGKTAALDSLSHTIVGVLPPAFAFPFTGVDVWFTRPSEWSALPPRFWGIPLLKGFGRLRPGVTLEQARAEFATLSQQYSAAHPGIDRGVLRVVWLKDQLVDNTRAMLWMIFGAVAFVLLIACANVASLLLARAASRSREFALRAAIGAGRGRLVRQLLAESLVLAIAGGTLGGLLANWSLSAIRNVTALNIPGAAIRLDGTVLAFTLALSLATGLVFGLLPSLRISRPDLNDVLRQGGAGAAQGRSAFNPRALLVVGQIALSIVLLIGATLLMQSFARLHAVNPGFNASNLLTMRIALPPARYDTDSKKSSFFAGLVERAEATPGVRAATVAMSLPTTTWIRTNITQVQGQPPSDDRNAATYAVAQSITPGYFRTLGIPILRGREFTARDNVAFAPPVIMINESLARRLWRDDPAGLDPVGQHIAEAYDKKAGMLEVVGIVADIHEGGLAYNPTPEFYVPIVIHPPQTAYLAVRTQGDPLALVNSIRAQILAIDRDQSVSEVRTMEAVFDATLGQRRLTMLLLASFAAIALLLTVVGIYGVIAYSVAERTQEVGIRRALGAQQADILRLVLRQGLTLALCGIAIGLAGSLALTQVIRGFLFHVSPTDPLTHAGIALLLVFVTLAACLIPAARAIRIDPMEALRNG